MLIEAGYKSLLSGVKMGVGRISLKKEKSRLLMGKWILFQECLWTCCAPDFGSGTQTVLRRLLVSAHP